jgi:hypothetical protein
MKHRHLLWSTLPLLVAAGFSACSSGKYDKAAPLDRVERYDPMSRSWVSADTEVIMPAMRSPYALDPENTGEQAQIIDSAEVRAANPPVETPGLMDRIGRAATSPLRAVGIGGSQYAGEETAPDQAVPAGVAPEQVPPAPVSPE